MREDVMRENAIRDAVNCNHASRVPYLQTCVPREGALWRNVPQ